MSQALLKTHTFDADNFNSGVHKFLKLVLKRDPTDMELNYYTSNLRRSGVTRELMRKLLGREPQDIEMNYFTSKFKFYTR